MKTTLIQEAEAEIRKLLKRVEELNEGDLKGVEHEVLTSMFALGRSVLERVVQEQVKTREAPSRRQGSCGHEQHLVDMRPKQVLTLLGPITIQRAYSRCQLPDTEVKQEEPANCTHGEAPADALLGIGKRRTSAGVQEQVSSLCALLTLEEAAAAFSRLSPLQMSARQALYLMQPVGEALAEVDQQQVNILWEQTAHAHTTSQRQPEQLAEPIERFSIELDGVLARLRCGSVPMEEHELQREGDVYREIKVGAVFQAKPGHERSELVEGVYVDESVEESLHDVAQRSALGDFGRSHPDGIAWAKHACDWLVHGQIDTLVTAIAALPAVAPPPGQSKSEPEQAIGYFTANAQRMRYPTFRAQGMQIGSGIAEATCKTVVSTRAKRTGMRWTPQGLDALLPLRTSVLNGSYDAFWQGRSHALV